MIRLLIFLITGLFCAIGGLFIGISSHQVTYRNGGREIVAHFLSGGSSSSNHIGYLQLENDNNLYIINEDDFSPRVQDRSFGDGDDISFIYRPVDTTNINVSATNTSTHMQGAAYTIVQFTVFPSNSSNDQQGTTYTSSEYSKNPHGYTQNNWLLGGGLLALGLLLLATGFILQLLHGRKKVEVGVTSENVTPPLWEAMPVSQYQQPQMNAYQQPFPNFTQYPQTQQYQQQYSPPPGQYNWTEGVEQEAQPVEQQQPKRQFQPRPGQFK